MSSATYQRTFADEMRDSEKKADLATIESHTITVNVCLTDEATESAFLKEKKEGNVCSPSPIAMPLCSREDERRKGHVNMQAYSLRDKIERYASIIDLFDPTRTGQKAEAMTKAEECGLITPGEHIKTTGHIYSVVHITYCSKEGQAALFRLADVCKAVQEHGIHQAQMTTIDTVARSQHASAIDSNYPTGPKET